jgi:hypothetical protein
MSHLFSLSHSKKVRTRIKLTSLSLLGSQFSECVNNNTENDVQGNNIDQHEEPNIEDYSQIEIVSWVIDVNQKHRLSDTSTISKA